MRQGERGRSMEGAGAGATEAGAGELPQDEAWRVVEETYRRRTAEQSRATEDRDHESAAHVADRRWRDGESRAAATVSLVGDGDAEAGRGSEGGRRWVDRGGGGGADAETGIGSGRSSPLSVADQNHADSAGVALRKMLDSLKSEPPRDARAAQSLEEEVASQPVVKQPHAELAGSSTSRGYQPAAGLPLGVMPYSVRGANAPPPSRHIDTLETAAAGIPSPLFWPFSLGLIVKRGCSGAITPGGRAAPRRRQTADCYP